MPLQSLAPANLQQQQSNLSGLMASISQVNAYATAVMQTNLAPIPDQSSGWYNALNANLQDMKGHSQTWLSTLQPQMLAIPLWIANFSQMFQVAASDIAVAVQNPNPGPLVLSLLQSLDSAATSWQNQLTGLRNQFTAFETQSQTDLTALISGAGSIENAITQESGIIARLNGDIEATKAEISKLQSLRWLGFLSPISLAVILPKLNAAENELASELAQMSNALVEVTLLTELSLMVTRLVVLNQSMGQSLSNIANFWADIESKLGAVITDLQETMQDADQQFFDLLNMDMQAAQLAWNDLATFAMNLLQNTPIAAVQ